MRRLVGALVLAGLVPPVLAQGIYTCIDAQGRRLTADRPIPECMDRTQREMSRTGTVLREIGPSLSPREEAERAAAAKQREAEQAEAARRLAEQKRRDQALMERYPNQGVHDAARASALAAVDATLVAANKRSADLVRERQQLEARLEQEADATRASDLRIKLRQLDAQMDGQKRFIQNQEAERQRIVTQFDDELARLKLLWGPPQP